MECPSPACMRTTICGCLGLCDILRCKAFQVKIMNRVPWAQLSVLLIPPMPFSVISQQSCVVDIRRRHRPTVSHFIGHLPFWQDQNQAYLWIQGPGFIQAKQDKQSHWLHTLSNLRELVWAGGNHVGAWHNSDLSYQLQEWTSLACMVRSGPIKKKPS